jgi:hypothetical protein
MSCFRLISQDGIALCKMGTSLPKGTTLQFVQKPMLSCLSSPKMMTNSCLFQMFPVKFRLNGKKTTLPFISSLMHLKSLMWPYQTIHSANRINHLQISSCSRPHFALELSPENQPFCLKSSRALLPTLDKFLKSETRCPYHSVISHSSRQTQHFRSMWCLYRSILPLLEI